MQGLMNGDQVQLASVSQTNSLRRRGLRSRLGLLVGQSGRAPPGFANVHGGRFPNQLGAPTRLFVTPRASSWTTCSRTSGGWLVYFSTRRQCKPSGTSHAHKVSGLALCLYTRRINMPTFHGVGAPWLHTCSCASDVFTPYMLTLSL